MKRITQSEFLQSFAREHNLDLQAIQEPLPPPIPACKICNDLGVVMPEGRWNQFVECPAECAAVHENRRNRIERQMVTMERRTNRRDKQYNVTFADIQPEQLHTDFKIAYRIAQAYIKNPWIDVDGIHKNSVVFTGETGTGKTYLASAIANELLKAGHAVWFARVAEICKRVQECYSQDPKPICTADQMTDYFCQFDYLVMDEFDLHSLSPDKKQIVESIIDYRYRKDLPTVCTTNLSQAEFIERWSDRTGDRLIHMAHWIPINGKIRNQNPTLKVRSS